MVSPTIDMPAFVALLIWFILLVALVWFDPAKETKAPLALWVPVIWMFFMGRGYPPSGSVVRWAKQLKRLKMETH